MRASYWLSGCVAFSSLAIFLLAYFSPVDSGDADPAVSLLASQAILDYGTLDLNVYRGHPDLAYDLDKDYRIFRQNDSYRYYSLGVPLFSVPAVWLANQFGYHMLNQAHEFALQNLLSALITALVFILFFALARRLVSFGVSYGIALVVTLGSSVVSTMATGLWNVDYQIVWICIFLCYVVTRQAEPYHWKSWVFGVVKGKRVLRVNTIFAHP